MPNGNRKRQWTNGSRRRRRHRRPSTQPLHLGALGNDRLELQERARVVGVGPERQRDRVRDLVDQERRQSGVVENSDDEDALVLVDVVEVLGYHLHELPRSAAAQRTKRVERVHRAGERRAAFFNEHGVDAVAPGDQGERALDEPSVELPVHRAESRREPPRGLAHDPAHAVPVLDVLLLLVHRRDDPRRVPLRVRLVVLFDELLGAPSRHAVVHAPEVDAARRNGRPDFPPRDARHRGLVRAVPLDGRKRAHRVARAVDHDRIKGATFVLDDVPVRSRRVVGSKVVVAISAISAVVAIGAIGAIVAMSAVVAMSAIGEALDHDARAVGPVVRPRDAHGVGQRRDPRTDAHSF